LLVAWIRPEPVRRERKVEDKLKQGDIVMEESSSDKTTDSTDPASGSPAVTPPMQTAAAPTTEATASAILSVKYLSDKLVEAELLLGYTAEVGIKVGDEVRDDVLKARIASDGGGFTKQTAANLLTALTTLAVNVRPVTVESLRVWENPNMEDGKQFRLILPVGILVSCIIVVFSLLTFVSKSISDRITTDMETANGLASKLRSELGPPPSLTYQSQADTMVVTNIPGIPLQDQVWFGPAGIPPGLSDKDVISDLQQFAATMREIDGYARQLKYCLFNFTQYRYAENPTNRVTLELTPGLNVRLSQELTDKVVEYQQVRNFGNLIVEKVMVYYGAIAISILPILYALLGAVAYLLRAEDEQGKNRTLIVGYNHLARILIACIGGLVVGQFNNVTQGINVTPFAVAFLVGYAVDVFFTFLEGLLQMFIKRGPGNP
jgi:hypothetical protein